MRYCVIYLFIFSSAMLKKNAIYSELAVLVSCRQTKYTPSVLYYSLLRFNF